MGPTLFGEHRLCGHAIMHLSVCLGFAAANWLPFRLPPLGFPASLALGHSLPVWWAWLREEGARCRQPPRHRPAGFLDADGRPSPVIPCLTQPTSRSVCFHRADRHSPPASCGLISSNGGGDCPWTASRSCPLLASSRIGGRHLRPRSCRFCLSDSADRPVVAGISQSDPDMERQL